jgi:uncharacterized protein
MLRVDVRGIEGGSVATVGSVAPDDPRLEGLQTVFLEPIDVQGMLSAAAGESFRWQAHLRTAAAGECRRCLAPVATVVEDDVDVMFSSDPELLDDPGVYEMPANAVMLDVTTAVREEIALRVPAFPLCRPDCQGLCPTCGADLNAGPCGCTASGSTS